MCVKSQRSIGRKVAAEVEKYFETKVNPETISMRASRQSKGVTNVTPEENPTIQPLNQKSKKSNMPRMERLGAAHERADGRHIEVIKAMTNAVIGTALVKLK